MLPTVHLITVVPFTAALLLLKKQEQKTKKKPKPETHLLKVFRLFPASQPDFDGASPVTDDIAEVPQTQGDTQNPMVLQHSRGTLEHAGKRVESKGVNSVKHSYLPNSKRKKRHQHTER